MRNEMTQNMFDKEFEKFDGSLTQNTFDKEFEEDTFDWSSTKSSTGV